VTDGLTERDRKGILSVLEGSPKVRRAILFGSRAIGTFRGASDLDLALEGDDIILTDLVAINARISRLGLPFEADFVIRTSIKNTDLERHIQAYGRVFYQRREVTIGANKWQTQTFCKLIDDGILLISDGYRAKLDELGGDGPIFLRAGHVSDSHIDFADAERFHAELEPRVRGKMSQPGDVVITTKGNSTGRVTYVSESMPPFVYSPHLSFWRSLKPNAVVPGFLRYWSRGEEFQQQLRAMACATDMAPYLSLVDQRRLRLTLPTPEEQRAIASMLGALDDKIELNRRMNETLEALARALFQSWFVNFDRVRASSGKFQDSAIGQIPKGWKVERFDKHITADRGLSYKGEGLREDGTGLPMHNLNSVYEGGGYKHEGIKYYAGEYREKHLLHPGDMIVTNTEQGFDHLLIGHAAIVPERYGPRGLFSHHIYRVRHKPSSPFSPHYLVELFNNPRWHYWISGFSNGTTINMLPMDALEMPLLVVPPDELVKKFTALAAAVHSQIEANLEQSRTLAALRHALLPKLLTGELRVPVATARRDDGDI
jgi:type I restriction enzyme S subunit